MKRLKGLFKNLFSSEKASIRLVYLGFILIGIGVISFLWKDWSINVYSTIKAEKFGQFGDFVGGIAGSIWSLAGVVLFYIALKEQRNDFQTNKEALDTQVQALNQQIEEFKLQRKELRSNRKIYEEQSKTQAVQQFESNFYALLNVYLTIKNNLNSLDVDKDYFKTLCNDNPIDFGNPVIPTVEENHNTTVEWYLDLFQKHRGQLSPYFKCFYRILRIIDSEPDKFIPPKRKTDYAKILRSQMTDYENLILLYNSYSNYGTKARSLFLRYNILKHNPVFSKPEFEFFRNLQPGKELILFGETLKWFMIEHVPKFYDLSINDTVFEDHIKPFNCTIGIYFSGSLDFKIICAKNIKTNNIQLSEDQMLAFLNFFITEHLVLNSYINLENVNILPSIEHSPNTTAFKLRIETSEALLKNYDKNH